MMMAMLPQKPETMADEVDNMAKTQFPLRQPLTHIVILNSLKFAGQFSTPEKCRVVFKDGCML